MMTSLQKSQRKPSNVAKKIKVEGEADEGREVVVYYGTAIVKWKGFESQMVIWTKIHRRI